MEIGNVTKGATFKKFLHLCYKSTHFFLTDDFWGLQENKNCAFPLNEVNQRVYHYKM